MAKTIRKRLVESSIGQLLVGIFVAVAAVGFGWLLFGLGQGPDSYPLIAEFETLGNISVATKVRLRGFDVGKVDGIQFQPTPEVGDSYFLVELGIEKRYPIPEGVVAEIRGGGLVGEASIHLDVSEAGSGRLPAGSRIPGRSDLGMKSLIAKVKDAAAKLGGAGGAIKDAKLGERLGSIRTSVAKIAADLGRMSLSADSLLVASRHMVTGMEPGIQSSLESLDRSMARLALTLSRTDTLVAATGTDVQGSVKAMRQLVERLDAVLTRVDALVTNKEREIDDTLSNLHAASAAVREISEHPWKLVTGQGAATTDTVRPDSP
ncbi:MAG: MlaD family protein [Candidatus Latescibacterota bacterium]|nr:MlaD family protein [Candidatus Latescibacterota bacterium]